MTEQQTPPWTNCEVHTHHTDTGCDFCEKQLQDQQQFLETLQDANQTLNMQLAAANNGIPFVETQPVVAVIMVSTMADMIFQDPKARMAFEINFAGRLKQQMETVHQQQVRQRIASGLNGAPVILSPEQRSHIEKIKRRGGG